MKKKVVLSAAFVISLLPMLLHQYGGARGVQEISGVMNLVNPIGILSVALFIAGVWVPFQKPAVAKYAGMPGCVGMVASEVYEFFTWPVQTITGEVSLRNSLRLAFPEFYIGLAVSVLMVVFYLIFTSRDSGKNGAESRP